MRFLIEIGFKSGKSFQMWFKHFKYTKTATNKTFEWELDDGEILFIDAEQIEYVIVLKKEQE